MTLPDYQKLMLPLLKCASNGDEVKTSNCVEVIANDLGISNEEKEQLLPSGKQTILSNRTNWAKSYMTKAGLIEPTKRGFFRITPRGNDLLSERPLNIDNKLLYRYPEFKAWKDFSLDTEENDNQFDHISTNEGTASPEEKIEEAFSLLNKQLKADILETLYSVSPAMFEKIIVELLIAMGYGGGRLEMGKALGRSGDGGVDGVIKEDELGLDVVYIQAKKHSLDAKIGRPDVQAFVGSLEGFNATKGEKTSQSDD
jgi:restriction system protein